MGCIQEHLLTWSLTLRDCYIPISRNIVSEEDRMFINIQGCLVSSHETSLSVSACLLSKATYCTCSLWANSVLAEYYSMSSGGITSG